MSAGLLGLLDDIAAIAKVAASSLDDVAGAAGRATAKTAGVVIDDTAVTPQYVAGVTPEREIPIVKRIALGSIRNKLLIVLPIALLLSAFAPFVIPYLLIAGGLYLSYEGAEKVWHRLSGNHHSNPDVEIAMDGSVASENKMVAGAVRTDLILSTEIMVVALNDVAGQTFVNQLIILLIVAVAMTAFVYGLVGLLVKVDDIGARLAASARTPALVRLGQALASVMPRVFEIISVVGTIAMLWVGGHILLRSLADAGLALPWNTLERLLEPVAAVAGVGGALHWLLETATSAVVGVILGSIIYWAIFPLRNRRQSLK